MLEGCSHVISPLGDALIKSNTFLVYWLLQHGANPNGTICDCLWRVPLMVVKNMTIAHLLLDAGACLADCTLEVVRKNGIVKERVYGPWLREVVNGRRKCTQAMIVMLRILRELNMPRDVSRYHVCAAIWATRTNAVWLKSSVATKKRRK
jgi:hypothetical protein